jgi:ribosomal protein L13
MPRYTDMRELGRRGGKVRLRTMTAEQRSAIARKAAAVSAMVRREKAERRRFEVARRDSKKPATRQDRPNYIERMMQSNRDAVRRMLPLPAPAGQDALIRLLAFRRRAERRRQEAAQGTKGE